jgi:hypothetical protein
VHGTQLCDEIVRLIDDILCGPEITDVKVVRPETTATGGPCGLCGREKRSQRGIGAGTGQLAALALSRACSEHRTSSDRVIRPSC